uniref:lethal(3)malignant brain tumor-like protein 2 isoform X3 n=1 Tax=Myxine glutinosa TaxID=7769 RepID=UPI00358E6666
MTVPGPSTTAWHGTPSTAAVSAEPSIFSHSAQAVCEMCGILGSHMAFYSHSKRFCSASCSRGFSSTYAPKCNKLMSFPRTSQVKKPIKQTKLNFNKMDARQNFLGPVKSFRTQNSEWSCKVFNWPTYLKNNICVTPSVNTLPHALMAKHWKDVKIGIKVEVLNRDCQQSDRTYWFATVIKIFGYYVLLRYEGMENDSLDFWNNICILSVHPVSWSNVQRWILAPPASIQHTQSDWNSFMVQRLSGSYTLPSVFHTKVLESLRWRGRVGMRLEVVDKASISQVRVASILDVVGGRICLLYENEFGSTNEKLRLPQKIFNRRQTWCHCWSPLIHPLGWARRVGHPIVNYTSLDYLNAVPAEDFYQPKQQHHEDGWKVGMKLEAVHPLNMSDICVATVSKVLLDGYIMIRTDDNYIEGNTLFCYHTSSACLLPAGWCQINKIPLIPPRERVSRDGDEFSWPKYLEKTGTVAVPAHLFDQLQLDGHEARAYLDLSNRNGSCSRYRINLSMRESRFCDSFPWESQDWMHRKKTIAFAKGQIAISASQAEQLTKSCRVMEALEKISTFTRTEQERLDEKLVIIRSSNMDVPWEVHRL